MMDDQLDDFIRRHAADYNTPTDVPTELLWARIRAARRAAVDGGAPLSGDVPTTASAAPSAGRVPEAPVVRSWRRRRARELSWGIGFAAMLALGIGIGRLTWTAAPLRRGPAAVAERGAAATSAGAPPTLPGGPTVPATAPAGGEAATGVASRLAAGPAARTEPSVRDRSAAAAAGFGGPDGTAVPTPGEASRRIYRLAANATLSQAEAVLSAYRAQAASRGVDRELVAWARDVLSSTRLLIDSPAGADPRLRPLLEDLETVLVQIVQLPAGPSASGERRIIDDAIQRRDVLPRLRTVIPAGPDVAGT